MSSDNITAAEILEEAFQDMHDLTAEIESILYTGDRLHDVRDVNSLSMVIYQCNQLLDEWIKLHN